MVISANGMLKLYDDPATVHMGAVALGGVLS